MNRCKHCNGKILYDKSAVLTSDPPKYKGNCTVCKAISYELCDKVNGISEDTYRQVDMLKRHISSAVRNMLYSTSVAHIEEVLTETLTKDALRHQEEIKQLKYQLELALKR